jgi:hypothetical protein
VDKTLRLEAAFILMFTLVITASTSASVYSQTTGDTESTKRWCEQKKDELKDRMTDFILLNFAKSANSTVALDMGVALANETTDKMNDCAPYLTGTEIQTLQQVVNVYAGFTIFNSE